MGILADLVNGLLITCLALVPLFAGRLRWGGLIPRHHWFSFGGGVSTAYVFVHILPELGKGQAITEHGIYGVALLGLGFFYGLEVAAHGSQKKNQASTGEDCTESHIFWVHVGSFALYSALIGYLFHHILEDGLRDCLLLFGALFLHFAVVDYSLREHHKLAYDGTGRFVIAAAILMGWASWFLVELGESTIDILWAFVGGGLILNVIKHELLEAERARFWPFALGAGGYAMVLFMI